MCITRVQRSRTHTRTIVSSDEIRHLWHFMTSNFDRHKKTEMREVLVKQYREMVSGSALALGAPKSLAELIRQAAGYDSFAHIAKRP